MCERRICTAVAVVLLVLGAAPGRLDGVVISEFMAANFTRIQDEDGNSSDWIEIYNDGAEPVNLAGWALTDNPTDSAKWRFPDVELGAGEFLLVFASGKNRVDPGSELHTNFRLFATGDYLGLRDPRGQEHLLRGRRPPRAVRRPRLPEPHPAPGPGRPGPGRTGVPIWPPAPVLTPSPCIIAAPPAGE